MKKAKKDESEALASGDAAPAADADPNLLNYGIFTVKTLVKTLFGQLKSGVPASIKFEVGGPRPACFRGAKAYWMHLIGLCLKAYWARRGGIHFVVHFG